MKSKVTPTTVLDFTLARYLRFRFQGMHTTQQSVNGIQWIFGHDELKMRSFYSLKYIKIGARLDCNGHAHQPKLYNDDEVSRNKNSCHAVSIRTSDKGIDCDLNWKSMLLQWFIQRQFVINKNESKKSTHTMDDKHRCATMSWSLKRQFTCNNSMLYLHRSRWLITYCSYSDHWMRLCAQYVRCKLWKMLSIVQSKAIQTGHIYRRQSMRKMWGL